MAVSTIAALPDFLPKLEAAEPAGTILTAIILVGFVVVGIWLLIEAVRRRTGVPILLLVGGLVAGLQEPMIDELGKVWWPTNLAGPAFTIFSRPMPYLQPTGYAMYIALGSYTLLRLIQKRADLAALLRTTAVFGALDIVLEMPWVELKTYYYYGDQPFRVFELPLWWVPINCATVIVAATATAALLPSLDGWRKLLVVAVPPSAWGGVYFVAGWPVFAGLNSDVPQVVTWMTGTVTIVAALTIAWLAARISTSSLMAGLLAGDHTAGRKSGDSVDSNAAVQ